MTEKIPSINNFNKFIQEPNSKNFINVFNDINTDYYEFNASELKIDVESLTNNIIFNHDNYHEFSKELWEALTKFDFSWIIIDSFQEKKQEASNESPPLDQETLDALRDNAYKMAEGDSILKGGTLNIEPQKEEKVNRAFSFFNIINLLDDDHIKKNFQTPLNNKAKKLTNILSTLGAENNHPFIKQYDSNAFYKRERLSISHDVIEFISLLIFKFQSFALLDNKKNKKKFSIPAKLDFITELIFFKLIFGKYHHPKSQIFVRESLKSLNYKEDIILFDRSYDLFLSVPNAFETNPVYDELFLNSWSISLPVIGHHLPQAAFTIFLRDLTYAESEYNSSPYDEYFINHCFFMLLAYQNVYSNVKKGLSNKEYIPDADFELQKEVSIRMMGVINLLFFIDSENHDSKDVFNLTLSRNEDLYVPPSLVFEYLIHYYEFNWHVKNLGMTIHIFDIDKNHALRCFLDAIPLNQFHYPINPFPIYEAKDVDGLLFDSDIFDEEKVTVEDLKKFSGNIYTLAFSLERYNHAFLDNRFDKYLQLIDKDTFTNVGLDKYFSLCFVTNFLHLLVDIQLSIKSDFSKNKNSKVFFNIQNFHDAYKHLKNDKSQTEFLFFKYLVNSDLFTNDLIQSKFGVLQKELLRDIRHELIHKENNLKNLIKLVPNKNHINDDIEWFKDLDINKFNTIQKINVDLNKVNEHTESYELKKIIAPLREFLESMKPQYITFLMKAINDNPKIKNKFFPRARFQDYSIGSWIKLLININQMSNNEIKGLNDLLSVGLREHVKKINKIDIDLLKQFERVTHILNAGSHHGSSIRFHELVSAYTFIVNQKYLGAIII